MKDRVPAAGKAGRVKLTLDDGTVLGGVLEMDDGATEQGTAWSKENVLTDAVAAAINTLAGSTPDVPNDALRLLTAALTATNSSVSSRAKIAYGSYAGTQSTSDYSKIVKTINFSFSPSIVVILPKSNSANAFIALLVRGITEAKTNFYYDSSVLSRLTSDITWGTSSVSIVGKPTNEGGSSIYYAQHAFNASGYTYYYVAIG